MQLYFASRKLPLCFRIPEGVSREEVLARGCSAPCRSFFQDLAFAMCLFCLGAGKAFPPKYLLWENGGSNLAQAGFWKLLMRSARHRLRPGQNFGDFLGSTFRRYYVRALAVLVAL